MINKNDCYDCDNCIWDSANFKWLCNVTQLFVPKQGLVEEDECPNFKYEE